MNKVLIIAECGHNFNGDIELAKKMIRTAKEKGADIAKFQLYDTDTLGIKEAYGLEVYNDLKLSELSFEQLKILKQECDNVGIEFLTSVFDPVRVKWTEKIKMKRYKIASRSITNKSLIDRICATNKDIIASLGMWNYPYPPDIQTKGHVDFLYCIAKYPTSYSDLQLPFFNNIWRTPYGLKYTGFSDHTIGIDASIVAVSRGAKIIEKHFTLDRNMPGYDQKGSMEPGELEELVKKTRIIEKILYY